MPVPCPSKLEDVECNVRGGLSVLDSLVVSTMLLKRNYSSCSKVVNINSCVSFWFP